MFIGVFVRHVIGLERLRRSFERASAGAANRVREELAQFSPGIRLTGDFCYSPGEHSTPAHCSYLRICQQISRFLH